MKCKYDTCENEAKGNGKYCSKQCRAKQSKRNRKGATIQAQPEQIEAQPQAQPQGATQQPLLDGSGQGKELDKYYEQPEQVADADRIRPGSIPLPGDADYKGVCEKVGGSFQVKAKPEAKPTNKLTPALLAKLPGGVCQPIGQPTEETKELTAQQLKAGINSYTGIDWKYSPEYAEIIYRLLTWSKAKLIESGQAVPQWKDMI